MYAYHVDDSLCEWVGLSCFCFVCFVSKACATFELYFHENPVQEKGENLAHGSLRAKVVLSHLDEFDRAAPTVWANQGEVKIARGGSYVHQSAWSRTGLLRLRHTQGNFRFTTVTRGKIVNRLEAEKTLFITW